MPKCLNWRNILSWIPVGSDLDPNSDNIFFFFFKAERIQISQKAGRWWPTSETPLNGVSLACWWWPNVECWLGSFWEFQGIRSSIAKKFYVFVIFQVGGGGGGGGDCPPSGSAHWTGLCLHLLRYSENPFNRAHRLFFFRSTSREREMSVLFEFHHFLTQRARLRISKIRRDVLEWLYYIINGICADGEQAKSILVFWRKNESVAIYRYSEAK